MIITFSTPSCLSELFFTAWNCQVQCPFLSSLLLTSFNIWFYDQLTQDISPPSVTVTACILTGLGTPFWSSSWAFDNLPAPNSWCSLNFSLKLFSYSSISFPKKGHSVIHHLEDDDSQGWGPNSQMCNIRLHYHPNIHSLRNVHVLIKCMKLKSTYTYNCLYI